MSRKPHFIFFNPDQWRGDVLAHQGNPAASTPTLDRLAQTDAVSFGRAFCQNPVCTPSRCSFMTGWYPHTRGKRSLTYLLHEDEPTMLHHLKDAGWHVWWGGKNDLTLDVEGACHVRHRAQPAHANLHADESWRPSQADYSMFAGKLAKHPGEEFYRDEDWCHVLEAERIIDAHTGDEPLCLFLALQYPHPPYGVEEPYYSAINRAALPPRIRPGDIAPGKPVMQGLIRDNQALGEHDETWWNELRATYYGMCARVDAQLERIVSALKRKGMYEDTALFFFSDHGDYTGDYGLVEKAQNLFEDCLTRVPFLLKPPAALPCRAGNRQALVELLDIPATVYELAGITPRYSHFGRSLTHLLANDEEHREAVFCEGGRRAGEIHCSEASGSDPASLYWPRTSVQKTNDLAHGKAIMCRTARYKYVYRMTEADEFYDLEQDPNECRNLIWEPACAELIAQCRERVLDFLAETSDIVPWEIDPRDV
jgi:arylsulfatase A-like enzyme